MLKTPKTHDAATQWLHGRNGSMKAPENLGTFPRHYLAARSEQGLGFNLSGSRSRGTGNYLEYICTL
jgi:hypothetical protein